MAHMELSNEVQKKSIGVATKNSQTVYLKASVFVYLPLSFVANSLHQRRVRDTGKRLL
jgi:hypothetical protein